MGDELNLNELEQVGTNNFMFLNEFVTAYKQGNMNKVVELGQSLLDNPMLSGQQKEEIAHMMDQAKAVLSNKEDTKEFVI